jgi:hypothetical protein
LILGSVGVFLRLHPHPRVCSEDLNALATLVLLSVWLLVEQMSR